MISRLRPFQVRKGDKIMLPEKTHLVVSHAEEVTSDVWEIEVRSQILRITDPNSTMKVDVWLPKLKRKKVGDAKYDILDETGAVVGNAVRTGRPGVDNYPWNWSVDFKTVDGSRTIGNGSTLAECIEYIQNAVRNSTTR